MAVTPFRVRSSPVKPGQARSNPAAPGSQGEPQGGEVLDGRLAELTLSPRASKNLLKTTESDTARRVNDAIGLGF